MPAGQQAARGRMGSEKGRQHMTEEQINEALDVNSQDFTSHTSFKNAHSCLS